MHSRIWAIAEERASGTVLAISILAAISLVASGFGLAAGLSNSKIRLQAAADTSAIAASQTELGAVSGSVCEVAAEVLTLNGAKLENCLVEGKKVSVTAQMFSLGFWLDARSSAEPFSELAD